ncbi:hypothetical protein KP509_05G097900 [Ceratopteris richardii]|uniref:Uncharacterized protein n=1 Tax=Ceratopteris richardii TaxID=49495 RepID=A0A8T2UP72_CERRI|nr:hypothetical protein KP509_05G097900 [Ceratopteris richardii]
MILKFLGPSKESYYLGILIQDIVGLNVGIELGLTFMRSIFNICGALAHVVQVLHQEDAFLPMMV